MFEPVSAEQGLFIGLIEELTRQKACETKLDYDRSVAVAEMLADSPTNSTDVAGFVWW